MAKKTIGATSAIAILFAQAPLPPRRQTRQATVVPPAREDGPPRMSGQPRRNPETPYKAQQTGLAHRPTSEGACGQAKLGPAGVAEPDFDGHYIARGAGEKSKCLFYADDHAFGWIYSGQVKVTIDGQEPKILSKGWAFNGAPRLATCLELPVMTRGVFPLTPAGQVPSYPENETPLRSKAISTKRQDHFDRRL